MKHTVIGDLWKVWRDGDLSDCLVLLFRQTERIEEANEISRQMCMLRLNQIKDRNDCALLASFSPASNIGSAIKLANHYGLDFYIGTHHGDCRAVLPRDKWQREINTNISLKALALFTIPKSYEEIENFQGISDRLEIAICKCLIQARIAGVI